MSDPDMKAYEVDTAEIDTGAAPADAAGLLKDRVVDEAWMTNPTRFPLDGASGDTPVCTRLRMAGRSLGNSRLGLYRPSGLRFGAAEDLSRPDLEITWRSTSELPNPGDYIRSYIGAIPIVVARDESGSVRAFENRCAHRGVEFCKSYRGTTKQFHLSLPSMDIRSQRRVDGRPLSPRRSGQGRHARRLRPERSFPEKSQRDDAARRRVCFLS